jgi:lipoate-protein ligase B
MIQGGFGTVESGVGVKRRRAVWSDLGPVDYERSLVLMKALRDRVGDGAPGHIIFLEHPPTITLGYSLKGDEGRSAIRSSDAELKSEGIRVVQVDRGGKATYHGPGQLVCYLMVSLKELRLGVKRYVGKLTDAVLRTLIELGAAAELDPFYPGVWVGGAKVAAVGIRVEAGVTTHGFAVNIDPDLSKFRHIEPCGIPDRPVTSLSGLGIKMTGRDVLIDKLLFHMEDEFRLDLLNKGPDEIWSKEREDI